MSTERNDGMTPREAAVLSLNSAFKNGRFVNLELDSAIRKYGFEDKDKSFYTRLLYGTVERRLTLDAFIDRLSERGRDRIEPLVLCILETALYQIFYMDRVPASAACNEATELVKRLCPGSYAGYVNAVLRSAVRRKEALCAELAALCGLRGVSLRHSIPEWICELWERDYHDRFGAHSGQGCVSGGEGDAAECIARGFESIPPHLTLRVNTLKTTADELFARIGRENDGCPARKISDTLITLGKSVPVEEIAGFDEGLFFVQDESSALCASLIGSELLAQTAFPVVIDTCACPGGKTFAMAMQLENRGTVYSFDLHANRLSLIESGTKRLGITSVITEARDARKPSEALFGKADAVLCDVPCSGLGILAKKPDIRYKNKADVERLPDVQRDILLRSADYVKPGGFLVYSTCTLRRAENEDNVAAFLAARPDFEPALTGFAHEENGMKTFFPQVDGTDGFFVAKLARKG